MQSYWAKHPSHHEMVQRIAISLGAWEPKRTAPKAIEGEKRSGIVETGKGDGLLMGLLMSKKSGSI